MTAIDILARLRTLGLQVTACDGSLRLVGTATVPADLVAAIREHRAEVLALLEEEAGVEDPATTLVPDQAGAHHGDRVEVFSAQAARPGGVPFLVVPGSPDTPDGCLSCGARLVEAYPPRCPACIAAAHQVLAEMPQETAQDAPGAAPPPRPACCPACGEGGLWRRVASPEEAFCVRCGVVAEPTGPGPPPAGLSRRTPTTS